MPAAIPESAIRKVLTAIGASLGNSSANYNTPACHATRPESALVHPTTGLHHGRWRHSQGMAGWGLGPHRVRSDPGSSLTTEASCRRRDDATGCTRRRRSSRRLVPAAAASASTGAAMSAAAASARCSTPGRRSAAGAGDHVTVTDSHHPALRTAPAASSRRQCPRDNWTCGCQNPWFSGCGE
jgi:hypothetical protein